MLRCQDRAERPVDDLFFVIGSQDHRYRHLHSSRRRPNDRLATMPSNCGNCAVTKSDHHNEGDCDHEQNAKQHTGPDEPQLNQIQRQLVPDRGLYLEDTVSEPWINGWHGLEGVALGLPVRDESAYVVEGQFAIASTSVVEQDCDVLPVQFRQGHLTRQLMRRITPVVTIEVVGCDQVTVELGPQNPFDGCLDRLLINTLVWQREVTNF